MPFPVKIGDSCKNGHAIVGDNVMIARRGGVEQIRCRECARASRRAYTKSEKGRKASRRSDAKRKRRKTPVRTAPAVRRPAAVVRAEWNAALAKDKKRNCLGREDEFVLYDYAPRGDRPWQMCEGCPLKSLCDEFAVTTKPGWGIWGGRAWDYGRLVGASRKRAA